MTAVSATAVKDLALEVLEEYKAQDVVCVAAEGVVNYTDYLLLASGRSSRHHATIAEKLRLRLKEAGIALLNLEGEREATWVLMDFGVLVVHLQTPEKRGYYDLEGLWRATESSRSESVENTARIGDTANAAPVHGKQTPRKPARRTKQSG